MQPCLEPGQLFPIELESPNGTRKFLFRSLSVREALALREKVSENASSGICEFVSKTLAGWENVKDTAGELVEFDSGKLLDVVSEAGLAELYRRFHFGPEDKKKSE
jgi:hypothetical protein